jgi:CBS-domain-containing membrane protein
VGVLVSALSVVEMMASGVRRVPIVNDAGAVVNLITQSSILKFIHQHADIVGDVLKETASSLNFTSGVLTVSEETPALEVCLP